MDLFHTRTQHSVGQGGFHSAVIDDGSNSFRYAYDCGSTNGNRLSTCVHELKKETDRLDVLFLSHLDQDHANGVDLLLGLIEVGTVVLPYLSPFERLVLVAEFLANPTSNVSPASLLAMLGNPVDWLAGRGVRQVIFVTPPGEGADPPTRPEPADSPADGDMKLDISAATEISKGRSTSPRRGVSVTELESTPLFVTTSGRPFWALVPFVQPEAARETQFLAAAAKILKLRSPAVEHKKWLDSLKNVLTNRTTTKALADAYTTHIRRDRNLTSMCLYSGPIVPAYAEVYWSEGFRYRRHRVPNSEFDDGGAGIGWLGTGDAHLDVKKRRDAFEYFYRYYLPDAGTVVLPHHGSKANIKTGFLQKNTYRTWVAAYGTRNSYGHPDPHLMRVANMYGDSRRVTERSNTTFAESFVLRW